MSQVDHGELVVEVLTWVEISKFYGAFVLNRRVDSLHGAIDAPPAQWRTSRCRFLTARRNQRGHAIAEK